MRPLLCRILSKRPLPCIMCKTWPKRMLQWALWFPVNNWKSTWKVGDGAIGGESAESRRQGSLGYKGRTKGTVCALPYYLNLVLIESAKSSTNFVDFHMVAENNYTFMDNSPKCHVALDIESCQTRSAHAWATEALRQLICRENALQTIRKVLPTTTWRIRRSCNTSTTGEACTSPFWTNRGRSSRGSAEVKGTAVTLLHQCSASVEGQ